MEKNKIVVFDVDGTLLRGQIQQHLIKYLYSISKVDLFFILKINLLFILYKIGCIKNVGLIFESGLRYIQDKDVNEIDSIVEEFIESNLAKKIFPDMIALLHDYKNQGYKVLLLSTAVDVIVSKLKSKFNVDDYIATKLEIVSGKYTGRIEGQINYGMNKVYNLGKYLKDNGLMWDDVIAYADHLSDFPLLKKSGKSYIVNPSDRAKEIAFLSNIDTIYTLKI